MSGQEHHEEPMGGMGALGDVLNKLMAHPEVLSYVASAIGVDQNGSAPTAEPVAEQKVSEASPSVSETAPAVSASVSPIESQDALAALAPLLSGLSKGKSNHGGQKDCRSALLLALKPYVSKGRCEAIDTMIRFSKLTDLFQTLH